MPRIVPVEFSARLLAERRRPVFFDVVPEARAIEIVGGVSTGDAGWTLSAVASRRRSQIALSVIMAREAMEVADSMEEHSYTARLLDLKPGAYTVSVHHVFRVPRGEGSAQSLVAFECRVTVP